jgi:uncharacterized membrane protein YoaK (UPF0700 family)
MSEILNEAWRTLVPERDSRHGPLPPLLLVLTVVTGFVDAYSYLVLGRVFVANMTGNVVFTGFALAGESEFSLPASLCALAAFSLGALAGGRITRETREHRGKMLHTTLLLEFALLVVAYFLAQLGPSTSHPGMRYVLIVLLGLAMGLQNAAARVLAVPDLTTTVLTLTITGTSADSRLAGGPGARSGRRLLSVLAMFVGALFGALAIVEGHSGVSLLCAMLLLAGALLAASRTVHSQEAWTRR